MFKKIIFIVAMFGIIISCNKEHSKEYATISGVIANNNAKEIVITSKGFSKIIPINLDGSFKDTLKIKTNGYHTFSDSKNKANLFISNGNDISIQYDYSDFDNTLVFTGSGSETSQYFVDKRKFDVKEDIRNYKSFFNLEKDAFATKIKTIELGISNLLDRPNIDSVIKVQELKNNKRLIGYLKQNYAKEKQFNTVLAKGKPSPKFPKLENFKGAKKALDDFKGKYVYVDVWATWCGPCKQQIPFFSKLIEEYKDKNIVFVGISTDSARRNGTIEKANTKWRAMVKTKKMKGVQLFAGTSTFNADFYRPYVINGIPRFILIDPDGNIVDANAPRPSQSQLKTLLNSLPL